MILTKLSFSGIGSSTITTPSGDIIPKPSGGKLPLFWQPSVRKEFGVTNTSTNSADDTFTPGLGTRLNAIYNNPGAMGPGYAATEFGGTPSGKFDTGHAFMKFPTPLARAAAQFRLWQNTKLYQRHTLGEAIKNWIGPGEHGEAEFIAKKLNIPLNTIITDQFLRGPGGLALMKAQAAYEGQNVITNKQWQQAQDWAYKGIKPDQTSADTSSSTPQVIIHSNPTIHIHGDASEQKLAAAYAEHVRHLSKVVINEVIIRTRKPRSEFQTLIKALSRLLARVCGSYVKAANSAQLMTSWDYLYNLHNEILQGNIPPWAK